MRHPRRAGRFSGVGADGVGWAETWRMDKDAFHARDWRHGSDTARHADNDFDHDPEAVLTSSLGRDTRRVPDGAADAETVNPEEHESKRP